MRHARPTLIATVVSVAATVAVALYSAFRLADAPIRGRPPGPDPFGALASAAALGIGVAAFYRLGRSIDRPTPRAAVAAGGIGGAIAGFAGGGAQALALSDHLGAVLAGYAVPPDFLAIALGAYVLVATCGGGVVAAACAYAGWHRAERGQPTG